MRFSALRPILTFMPFVDNSKNGFKIFFQEKALKFTYNVILRRVRAVIFFSGRSISITFLPWCCLPLYMLYFKMSCVYCCQLSCVLLQLSCVYCCHLTCISCTVCVLLFFFRCRTAGQKSVFGRSCDRPPRHRFFFVSLCL